MRLFAVLHRSQCHQTARVLQSYLDGEIEPSAAVAVAEHLEFCRRCGLEVETYEAIKAAILATDRAAPVDVVDRAAVARLREFAQRLSVSPNA